MEQVLFDNIIVEIRDKRQGLLYKADIAYEQLQTRVVEVISCGPGYWNKDSRDYDGMVVKPGDWLVVHNNQWTQIDSQENDQHLCIKMHNIIKVIEPREDV